MKKLKKPLNSYITYLSKKKAKKKNKQKNLKSYMNTTIF